MPVNHRKNNFLLAPATGLLLSVLFFVFHLIGGVKHSPLWAILLIFVTFFGAFVAYLAFRTPKLYEILPFRKFEKYDIPLLFAGAFLLICISILVKFGVFDGGASEYAIEVYGFSFAVPKTVGQTVSLLFAAVILPTLFDELFFRGAVLYEARRGGPVVSCIVGAVLYGFLNLTFRDFVAFFLYGIVYAMLLFVTKNLLCTLLAHFFFGVYSVTLEKYVYVQMTAEESKFLFLLFTFLILIGALTVFLLFAEKKLRHFAASGEPYPVVASESKRELLLDLLTSYTFWIYFAVFIGIAVLQLFI